MDFDDLFGIAIRGVSTLPQTGQEKLANAAIAAALAQSGQRVIWVAASAHSQLGDAACRSCFKRTKVYDIAWAASPSALEPDALCQVKLGQKADDGQEVLLFLGDIVYAALDRRLHGDRVYVIGLVAVGAKPYWNTIRPQGRSLRLVLDPTSALPGKVKGVDWLRKDGAIQPAGRGQYEKIFGAGTNAKFVGLYSRPGVVTVECAAARASAGVYDVILIEPLSLSLNGASLPLESWWP
jgi:hypothetical protein